ncbi:MAG: AI-2E family transporter [Firmicutes bacterium]|nr:AI-2E family transporter [Bacillota bacterium]
MREKIKEYFKDRVLTRYSIFIICTATILYIIYFVIKNIGTVVPAVGDAISWVIGLFASFFIGLVLAYLIKPLEGLVERKTKLEGKKFGRIAGVLITYLLLIIIIAAILYGFGALIMGKVVLNNIPQYFNSLLDTFQSYEQSLRNWAAHLPSGAFSDGVQNLADSIIGWVTKNLSAASAANSVLSVVGSIVNIVLGLIFSVYILLDRENLVKFWNKMLDILIPKYKNRLNSNLHEVDAVLSSFVKGIAVDAMIIAILSSIGLTVVGVRFAVFLGIFAGICNVIPYFGPLLGMIPSFLVAMMTADLKQGIIAVLVLFVIQQLDANLIYPKVVGSSTGLHPLYVLLAVTVGGGIGGLLGMVLAVPAAGVIKLFFDKWTVRREKALEQKDKDTDSTSSL